MRPPGLSHCFMAVNTLCCYNVTDDDDALSANSMQDDPLGQGEAFAKTPGCCMTFVGSAETGLWLKSEQNISGAEGDAAGKPTHSEGLL